MDQNALKQAAAKAAIAYVPIDAIVGVGTGSTVNFFIAELAKIAARIKGAVSSSEASAGLLREAKIEVMELNDAGPLPVYIDGADEISRGMSMIKGGGAALTREKIVAAAADKFISSGARWISSRIAPCMYCAKKPRGSSVAKRRVSGSSSVT